MSEVKPTPEAETSTVPRRRRMPFHKRYQGDFLAGMMALTAEERGVFCTLVDLMYQAVGPIPNDAQRLARVCGCQSTRRFNAILARLAAMGKIDVCDIGLSNRRALAEVAKFQAQSASGNTAEIGHKKSSQKTSVSRDCNDLGLTEFQTPRILESESVSLSRNDSETAARASARETKSDSIVGVGGAKPRQPRHTPRSRIPPEWCPDDASKKYARERGIKIKATLLEFRNNYEASGAAMSDWQAAWRKWCDGAVRQGIGDAHDPDDKPDPNSWNPSGMTGMA